jgi:hypothetical protein
MPSPSWPVGLGGGQTWTSWQRRLASGTKTTPLHHIQNKHVLAPAAADGMVGYPEEVYCAH